MIPVIGFIGEKKSGKTAVLTEVIKVLAKKGRNLGVLKHTGHGFKLDHPGTDSYKLFHAGARKVVLLGHGQIGFYGSEQPEPGPNQVRDLYLSDLDLVLVEGFKDALIPKVLMALKGQAPKWADKIGGLIAVVSPKKTRLKVKHFKPGQARELAKLIDGYIKSLRPRRELNIYLDGKKLSIKPFIKDFFLNSIAGMVGSLRGAQGAKRIQITIQLPKAVSVPIPGE